MSWIEKLCRTYDGNLKRIADPNDSVPLLPLYHSMQNAQIHIILDGDGNYLRASVVSKEDAKTIIPATEDSAGRSGSKIAPHPLFDTLQYVAGDYLTWGGNPNKKKNESGYEQYINALRGWVNWAGNRKLESVLVYLEKGCLISDLVNDEILFPNSDGKLAQLWQGASQIPPIFKAIKNANKKGQYESFVRFSVEIIGDPQSRLWKDIELQELWTRYVSTLPMHRDICLVIGDNANIASNHPKYIRYPGDGAKLISSNDEEGFTYLGRFTNDKEACSVSLEATHKAHNALRWLIKQQGYWDGDQAIVAWAISGVDVPDLCANTLAFILDGTEKMQNQETSYTAEEVGNQLSKRIAGYAANLGPTEEVVVMGLDSATPGRMAISFYRELTGSKLLERVQSWHEGCCWLQRFGKDRIFIGAPAPRDIAETAYGRRLDDKLRKATVERILPCIVDGLPIPRDLVESCVRRGSNRQGIEYWEWEKALGIACALYKYYYKERNYSMALDRNRTTRDYLYGRLLALAEYLEERALYVGGEKRETNAGRLMQRFAERPYTTWLTIETGLTPYITRLRASRPGFLHNTKTQIDEVMNLFTSDDFIDDHHLSGEFLLGYHCQRSALHLNVPQGNSNESDENIEGMEE